MTEHVSYLAITFLYSVVMAKGGAFGITCGTLFSIGVYLPGLLYTLLLLRPSDVAIAILYREGHVGK